VAKDAVLSPIFMQFQDFSGKICFVFRQEKNSWLSGISENTGVLDLQQELKYASAKR